ARAVLAEVAGCRNRRWSISGAASTAGLEHRSRVGPCRRMGWRAFRAQDKWWARGCSEDAPATSSGPDRCPVSDHRGQAVPNGQPTAPIFPKDLTTSLQKNQLSLLYRLSDDTPDGTTQTWPDHLSHRGDGRSRRGIDPPAGHHRRYLPCRSEAGGAGKGGAPRPLLHAVQLSDRPLPAGVAQCGGSGCRLSRLRPLQALSGSASASGSGITDPAGWSVRTG